MLDEGVGSACCDCCWSTEDVFVCTRGVLDGKVEGAFCDCFWSTEVVVGRQRTMLLAHVLDESVREVDERLGCVVVGATEGSNS